MKKQLLLFLFIGFFVLGTKAQQKDTLSIFSISANGGIGVPCGYFGRPIAYAAPATYSSNQDGGNALSGDKLNIEVHMQKPHQKWGLVAAFNYYSNAFNIKTFTSSLSEWNVSFYGNKNAYYTGFVTGKYTGYGAMGGISFVLFQTPRTRGYLNLLIGYTENTFPGLNYSEYNVTDNSFIESWNIQSAIADEFSYEPSMKLCYTFTKNWAADFAISFFYSKPTFYLNQSEYDPTQYPTYEQYKVTALSPVSLYSFTLGVGYQF